MFTLMNSLSKANDALLKNKNYFDRSENNRSSNAQATSGWALPALFTKVLRNIVGVAEDLCIVCSHPW